MDIKKLFKVLGMPTVYTADELGCSKALKTQIAKVISNAPASGLLYVSGNASPIVTGMFEDGRKVAAVDYLEYFEGKFSDTSDYQLPPKRKGQVTLVYNLGKEAVKNYEYSAKLLKGLISRYSDEGVCVLEGQLTPSTFNLTYGLDIVNKMAIKAPQEKVWV